MKPRFQLVLNETDQSMVEMWQGGRRGDKTYLVTVFHIDAFLEEPDFIEPLNDGQIIGIEIGVL